MVKIGCYQALIIIYEEEMRNKIFGMCIILIVILYQPLFSHPRYTLLYKDKCSSCHYNPKGGGMRTEDGFTFGRNVVSMFSSSGKELLISPKLSDNISFGFDYRTQYLYSGEKKRSDFQDMTGSLYLNAALSEKFDVVTRYDFVQSIWEGYAVAKILPNNSYIKAGTFVPDFGIKLDDHTAYTRGGDFGLLFSTGSIQGLIFNPFFTITGLEFGAHINDLLSITASVGKSKFNTVFSSDPVWTTRAEVTPQLGDIQFLFGGSFSATKTKHIDVNSGVVDVLPTNFFGGFADLALGPVSLTGEFFIGAFNDGWYKLTGLYMIDLDPFTLGLGGGLQGVVNPDSSALFLEGYASIAVSDSFSIYGSVDYWFAGYANTSAGLSLAF